MVERMLVGGKLARLLPRYSQQKNWENWVCQKRKRQKNSVFLRAKFHQKVIAVSKENSGPALNSPWLISFDISRPLRKEELLPWEKLSAGQAVTNPSFTKQQKPVLWFNLIADSGF